MADHDELVLCRHCGFRLVTARRDSQIAPDAWVHESSRTTLCHPVTFAEPVVSGSPEEASESNRTEETP